MVRVDVARASAYVTRFCGHEFGRLPRPYSDWPTPEIPNNVSQIVLERVLRRCAERARKAPIHFGWRLQSFAAHDDHVVADVEHTQTGERAQQLALQPDVRRILDGVILLGPL